jgi:adenylylsulfate kinase
LDGDVIRRGMSSDLGFSRADRHENVRRITRAAEEMVRHGVIVLVSAMSPYRDARAEARSRIPEFTEIYVNAPVEVCERRDTKGLYQRARMGQVSDVPGVDSPYEPPVDAEVECHTDQETVEESLAKVMRYLTPLLEPARALGQSKS